MSGFRISRMGRYRGLLKTTVRELVENRAGGRERKERWRKAAGKG